MKPRLSLGITIVAALIFLVRKKDSDMLFLAIFNNVLVDLSLVCCLHVDLIFIDLKNAH